MTSLSSDGGHQHVAETFRYYRVTTAYICIAITVVIALLIWGRFDKPAPTVCTLQTIIITQGEHR